MNRKTKIQLIESKIVEIKTLLTHWTQQIQKYTLDLENLTNQLNQIKK